MLPLVIEQDWSSAHRFRNFQDKRKYSACDLKCRYCIFTLWGRYFDQPQGESWGYLGFACNTFGSMCAAFNVQIAHFIRRFMVQRTNCIEGWNVSALVYVCCSARTWNTPNFCSIADATIIRGGIESLGYSCVILWSCFIDCSFQWQIFMWCNLGESVRSRTYDIFSFLFDWSPHLERYILFETPFVSVQWFQGYEQIEGFSEH